MFIIKLFYKIIELNLFRGGGVGGKAFRKRKLLNAKKSPVKFPKQRDDPFKD